MYSNPFLRAGVSAIALGLAFSSPAKADDENAENLGFILPPLVVTGNEDETVSYRQPGASTTLTEFDLERRDAYRASEALDSIPGVHFQPGNRGGGRNESSVYIRGFDLSRVPVLLDGIPIYVPYDGYIDLNRMMTFDLAAVEVARGYTSVLYGPNAMAGAINLVTRRPDTGLTGRVTTRMDFSDDLDRSGTRINGIASYGDPDWYLQAAASWLDQDFTTLPDDFSGGLVQPSGKRLRSEAEDKSLNIKGALTPGDDEYALTVQIQEGQKGAPPYAGNTPGEAIYFDWPYYDKTSVYLTTLTNFTSGYSLKTRAYYDSFENQLKRYDDASYTTQFFPFAFTSSYDDDTWGGSVELSVPAIENGELKFAAFAKLDTHRETPLNGPTSKMQDLTTSIATSIRVPLMPRLTGVAGFSYDHRDARRADDPAFGGAVAFPTENQDAFNWQFGAEYDLTGKIQLYSGVSQKTRFASMYERYSYRLGNGLPNPGLEAEELLTIEAGIRGRFTDWLTGSAGLFWGKADNYIQSVTVGVNPMPPFNPITQNQNVGEVELSGVELDFSAKYDWFTGRLAYTYLDRELTQGPGGVFLFGTPDHKIDVEAGATIAEDFYTLATFAYRSDKMTSDTGTGDPVGGYSLFGLKAGWNINDTNTVEIAAQNLFDKLYEYDNGYPGVGRSYSITYRVEF